MSNMNHLQWMGHGATILEIQKSLRSDPESCEVTLVAKDNSVRAHRFVLSSCSDFLRGLLQDIPSGQEATIILPDINGYLLESVLSFMYLGETSLTSANLSEFLEATNILGIKSAISFECSSAAFSGNLSSIPLSEIQMEHDNLIEQDNSPGLGAQDSIPEQTETARELEFLEVYNDTSQKITYSIEQISSENPEEEFMLTKNSESFTLSQNNKMNHEDNEDTEIDDEAEEAHIIHDFDSNVDPIIEMESVSTLPINNTSVNKHGLKIKPKVKSYQLDDRAPTANIEHVTLKAPTKEERLNTYVEAKAVEGSPIDLAIQAVLLEGMSLQKASARHDVSKTVLWRRVRKHPNYSKTHRENPVLTIAYERLKMGEALKTISRELDIPISTLHRHKVRLAQEGRLPNYVSLRKRDNASKAELQEKLKKAVEACVHQNMSQNHAANVYNIPKSTLWRHLQRRVARLENLSDIDLKEEVILS